MERYTVLGKTQTDVISLPVDLYIQSNLSVDPRRLLFLIEIRQDEPKIWESKRSQQPKDIGKLKKKLELTSDLLKMLQKTSPCGI